MKNLFPIVAMFTVVSTLHAQATPAPVEVRAQTILQFAPGEDPDEDFVGAPGGKLIYYLVHNEIRVYDRTSKATRVVGKGSYDGIATSATGDWLALERAADNSGNVKNAPDYVWTLPVDPRTGTATGEPRRVSLVPGGAPAFSPDGKWIAFVTNDSVRRLAVVPASGGPERVVFTSTARRPNWPVADPLWSADGKWIYFAQRASEKNGERNWVKWRVPSSGGAATPVTDAGQDVMLSPGAQYAITTVQDTTDGITFAITDLSSKKVVGRTKTFSQKAGDACYFAWSGKGLNMLAAMDNSADSLHVRSIASAADHVVSNLGFGLSRSISPDRKMIAAVVHGDSASTWAIAIMNADGSNRRVVQAGVPPMRETLWSPDGKFLSFWGDSGRLYIADAASGKATQVGFSPLMGNDMRWRPDSRSLLYFRNEGTPLQMHVSLRETSFNATDRLVRDITPDIPRTEEIWSAVTWFLGDSSLLVIRSGLVMPIGGGASHNAYDPIKISTESSAPVLSKDGRWIAIPTADGKAFHVASADGKIHREVPIPESGKMREEAHFLADNHTLIVATTATPTTQAVIYLIPVDGGSPRTLLKASRGDMIFHLVMSPDGTTVMYMRASPSSISLVEADLGAGLYSNTPVKH